MIALHRFNLLYETKYNLKFNISTRHILPRCGNLFVEKEIILNLQKYNSKNCYKEKYYDTSLKNLIKEADFIFLASSWEFDEVKHISKSVGNIKKITNSKVYIVGRKFFPNHKWSTKKLITINYKDRPSFKEDVNDEHLRIHNEMKVKLRYENLIDLHDLICEESKCRIFDENSNLLSYDGSHFTKDGVKFMAHLINNKSIFSNIFD